MHKLLLKHLDNPSLVTIVDELTGTITFMDTIEKRSKFGYINWDFNSIFLLSCMYVC